MASEIDIWNAALFEVGQKAVVSKSEDSAAARLLRARYDGVREALLMEVAPTFARKRAKLPRLAGAPEFGWTYFYQLPSADWLTNIGAWDREDCPRGGEVDHQLEENHKLATNAEQIYIKYIANISDPNIMSPLFREALSAQLAVHICNRINELSGRRQDMERWARSALNKASSADGQSDTADLIPEGSWITEREGGALLVGNRS